MYMLMVPDAMTYYKKSFGLSRLLVCLLFNHLLMQCWLTTVDKYGLAHTVTYAVVNVWAALSINHGNKCETYIYVYT